MADKEAKVKVGVEGAEEVGRAAEKAVGPWEEAGKRAKSGWKEFGKDVGEGLKQVGSDLIRVATAARAISFAQAVQSSMQYRQETTRTAIATGQSLKAVRSELESISKATLQTEP